MGRYNQGGVPHRAYSHRWQSGRRGAPRRYPPSAGNVIVSSGTNLAAGMPPEAGQAFQQDLVGAFNRLIDTAIAAKSKCEQPAVVDFIKALFPVEDNFPKHVFRAAMADPNGVFNWNIAIG
jgi:hypothetical protein